MTLHCPFRFCFCWVSPFTDSYARTRSEESCRKVAHFAVSAKPNKALSSVVVDIVDGQAGDDYSSSWNDVEKAVEGLMLCFSVTDRKSFDYASKRIQLIESMQGTSAPRLALVICATKCDSEQREVSQAEGHNFASQCGAIYVETSAKSGSGVDEAFSQLLKCVLSRSSAELATGDSTLPSRPDNATCQVS